MKRCLPFLLLLLLLVACGSPQPPKHFHHEVLNGYTPVKNQGKSQSCWIYAMLAAIETEHIMRGDSVHLSVAYVQKMLEQEGRDPQKQRGMGATLIRLIEKYGMVPYESMRTARIPAPRFAFMLGAQYTPQEFARSVCAPGEYAQLTSDSSKPYYEETVVDLPDNWMLDRFLNLPIDTLLAKTELAVRQHHGVCWESKGHAMAIVGIARDDEGKKYFVMKNSWGTSGPYHGLKYLSFDSFRRQTLAVELPASLLLATVKE